MQCFCVVCDKEASKCQQWGTGLSPADHCNAKAATCKRPTGAAAPAAPQAHGVFRSYAGTPDSGVDSEDPHLFGHGLYDPDGLYDQYPGGDICSACDCDPYDSEGECTGCGHMAGEHGGGYGMGGLMGLIGGIGAAFGGGYPYGHASSAADRVNAWTYDNNDSYFYSMTSAAKRVLQTPSPAKRVVMKAAAKDLKDSVNIGTMHFPVKVCLQYPHALSSTWLQAR